MTTKPTAIGYLRRDVSGIRQDWHEIQMRSLAKLFGYDLAKTVVFTENTTARIVRLMTVVWRVDAAAVIVPSVEHFGAEVPVELVKLADVITVAPRRTYQRTPPSPFGA
ncbi:hypothetical protein [Nocardia sp. CNY236]|uniref:hypothetical protein n=1 Tax=Nocardia sp. CNY236 TaxID=1169152 RepID=UPI0004146540|nr:hypothetical protein [Nocardia sp. CNY236]